MHPPYSEIFKQRGDGENRPWEQSDDHYRQIKPNGLWVVIAVGAEARKVMFENENAEKFWVAKLNSDVPRQGQCRKTRMPGSHSVFQTIPNILSGYRKCNHDDCSQEWRNRTFRQRPQSYEPIKAAK